MAMKTLLVALASSVAFSGLNGCFLSFLSPLPDMKTPTDRARAVLPKCATLSEDKVASFASSSTVDSVEPGYSFVASTATDHEARLRGALIHLRPYEGMTKEKLTRGLECHQARVTLGLAPPLPDDPYVLPNRWLSVDVNSDGDSFGVQVRADTFPDAQRVLERAKLFVANRPPEVATDHPARPAVGSAEGPSAAVPPLDPSSTAK
jgi:hypothetical protein